MDPALLEHGKAAAVNTPFFMAGADDRPSDARVVAVAIGVRCEIKVGDRDFSCPLNLHEIALYRRLYDARGGGSIRVRASWPPGLSRLLKLTQGDMMKEAERLAKTCVVPREGMPPRMVFAELFGSEPAVSLERLTRTMGRQMEAWAKLVKKAFSRLDPADTKDLDPRIVESMAFDQIVEQDLDDVINIANPMVEGLSGVVLPEIDVTGLGMNATASDSVGAAPAKPAASAPSGVSPMAAAQAAVDSDIAEGVDAVLDALTVRAGLTQALALEVAMAIERANDIALVTDAELMAIVGDETKVKAVRAALK